jgi:hypothetical protein
MRPRKADKAMAKPTFISRAMKRKSNKIQITPMRTGLIFSLLQIER